MLAASRRVAIAEQLEGVPAEWLRLSEHDLREFQAMSLAAI